jgi:hypothetical protein
MTTVLALAAVGLASLLFRTLPLLGAARVPGTAAMVAGWAGLSVLAAITVRSVLHHQDATIPFAVPVALVSVALGLVLTARGSHMLVALGAGAATYLALAAALATLG